MVDFSGVGAFDHYSDGRRLIHLTTADYPISGGKLFRLPSRVYFFIRQHSIDGKHWVFEISHLKHGRKRVPETVWLNRQKTDLHDPIQYSHSEEGSLFVLRKRLVLSAVYVLSVYTYPLTSSKVTGKQNATANRKK